MAHPPGARANGLPLWQPWVAVGLFAFLLHFTWEMLQVPFYRDMPQAPHWAATLVCFKATLGDVVITEIAFGAVALASRHRAWLARPSTGRLVLYVGVGLVITAAVELLSVHVWERWAYAPNMPLVFGIGALPLLQWLLLPPLVLWFARRHLGWGPGLARTTDVPTRSRHEGGNRDDHGGSPTDTSELWR